MKQKESMKQSETMKQTTKKSESQTYMKVYDLQSEEFGKVITASDMNFDGYFCLDDLCRILNLQETEMLKRLEGHLCAARPADARGEEHTLVFIDEFGLYMLFIMSEEEDAIRLQDWLDYEVLEPLHEQKMNQMGLDKDAKIFSDSVLQVQSARYVATAENVRKSGHFKVGKDIPELTMSHLIGWWYNDNDESTFMLQFDSKSNCLVYQNVRMNVYLKKMRDGSTDQCLMTISFLDLDDDNAEFFAIDAYLPCYVLSESTILDYIFAAYFERVDLVESGDNNRVMILNGTMSFRRSRRV